MDKTELMVWLMLVLGVGFIKCQHNQDSHSLGDVSRSRMARQSQLRVGVLELPPYVIIDKSKPESDQERYTGLAIDVLKKVTENLGLRYTIELQEDDLPGQKMPNGSWNGLVERLIERKVDVGGPLHITSDRERVLDFTKPIVNSGISYLIKEARVQARSISLIFEPFSTEVWLTLLIAFIIISILFYTICRVSPYSNVPQPRVSKTNGFLSKITDSSAPYSIKNSFLYTINALTFQGQRNTPKSWAARILSVFWALFCLIMIIVYASSLASFVIAGRGSSSILKFFDIESLMRTGGTSLGIVRGRYEDAALKVMDYGVWKFAERKGIFFESYSQGIQRLRISNGNLALAMDTQAAKYVALRHCDLKKLKSVNPVGIGFATSPGNRVVSSSQLDQAILRLHEDGTLTILLKKWLNEGSMCSADIDAKETSRSPIIVAFTFTLKDMSSPLIFVFVGALIAIVVLIAEVIYVRCFLKGAEKAEETRLEENKLEEGDGDITKEEVVVASP